MNITKFLITEEERDSMSNSEWSDYVIDIYHTGYLEGFKEHFYQLKDRRKGVAPREKCINLTACSIEEYLNSVYCKGFARGYNVYTPHLREKVN